MQFKSVKTDPVQRKVFCFKRSLCLQKLAASSWFPLRHRTLKRQNCLKKGEICLLRSTFQIGPGLREKTHEHKQICGIIPDWMGAKKLFICFLGSFLIGEKIPQKIPGQSPEIFVYVSRFFFIRDWANLVKAILRLRNAFKNRVLEAPRLVTTKTLLLKHYDRRQGLPLTQKLKRSETI